MSAQPANPLPNGENGHSQRDSRGRFIYHPGPGNPHSKAVGELRSAMLRAITAGDVESIITALVNAAKQGDTVAAREVLDRTIGKPAQSDVLARLEALEQALAKRGRL